MGKNKNSGSLLARKMAVSLVCGLAAGFAFMMLREKLVASGNSGIWQTINDLLYGDNVFEKDGIRRDRTGDGEKTRCLCGKRGIFNRDGPAMGPQIIRQLE